MDVHKTMLLCRYFVKNMFVKDRDKIFNARNHPKKTELCDSILWIKNVSQRSLLVVTTDFRISSLYFIEKTLNGVFNTAWENYLELPALWTPKGTKNIKPQSELIDHENCFKWNWVGYSKTGYFGLESKIIGNSRWTRNNGCRAFTTVVLSWKRLDHSHDMWQNQLPHLRNPKLCTNKSRENY